MTNPEEGGMRKRYEIIPFILIAWLLHGLSEWCYSAASWIYKKCGTDIFTANITWEK